MTLKTAFFSLFVAIFFITPFEASSQTKYNTYAFDAKSAPREHPLDFIHIMLELKFAPEKGMVSGIVTHTFTPLWDKADSVFLDGPGITIKSVTLAGKSLRFNTNNDGVWIYFQQTPQLGMTYALRIEYEATPKKGLYFIGWNDPSGICRKQIWSQGQSTDNRYWIPMYDEQNDKVVSEVKVTFASEYSVLSNGVLVSSKQNADKTTSWHYKMSKPHATYLIMLGIGEYKQQKLKSASGIPLTMWYYPDHEDRVNFTYKYMVEMMDFFEKEIGVPYPWETYSQIPVQDFMYGAMENTTATVFGDFFCVDQRGFHDRNYVGVNAHELAHQWFGDLVTARNHPHHWLQESFATHYNMMYEGEAFGKEYYDWARRSVMPRILNAEQENQLPLAHSNAGSPRFYPKGALVLHMLKYVVGRENYNRAIKYYLQKHAYKNVDSRDLLVAFHESLGKSLDWFWEQWVFKSGVPRYEVNYQVLQDANNTAFTQFTIKQTHEVNEFVSYFKMPINVQVVYTDGSSTVVQEWVDGPQTQVMVPNPSKKQVAFVLFDPNSEIMKEVEFTKPVSMFLQQAEKATHMIDRYDALVGLRTAPIQQKRNTLLAIAQNTKEYYPVRAEALKQLYKELSEDQEVKTAFDNGLKGADIQLRKQLIGAVNSVSAEQEVIFMNYFTDADASYELIEQALVLLVQTRPEKASTYLTASKDIIGVNSRNVRIKWLELGIQYTKHKSLYTQELIDLTSGSYEFGTRVRAMDALVRLNVCTPQMVIHVADAILNPNTRLSGPMGRNLASLYKFTPHKKVIDETLATSDKITPAARKKLQGVLK